jgi:Tol biopolymer transport system component
VLVVLIACGVVLAGSLFWRSGPAELAHDGAPAWSPDSQQIVFSVELPKAGGSPRRDTQADLFVMRADGSARRQITWTPANEAAPMFSPDGRRIAFETDRDGNFEIYEMAADGGSVRNVSNNAAADRSPAWAPDAERMAFLSDRDRKPDFDVYTMKTDGTDVRRVTNEGKNWAPQYSPAGQRLAIQTGRDIQLFDLLNGTRLRLTFDPKNGMSPAWSPDASRVAFTSTRNGRLELFAMDSDGSHQDLLVSMSGASAMEPRWSPDGSRIAFVQVPDQPDRGEQADQPYAIYVLELATRKVTRLSP